MGTLGRSRGTGPHRALHCAGESWSRASGRFCICKLSWLTPASAPGLVIMQVLARIQGRPTSSLRPPGCAQGWVCLAQDTRLPRAFDAKEGIPQSSLRASLSDGEQAGWGSAPLRWPLSPMCPRPWAVGTLPTERTHLCVSLSALLLALGPSKFAPDPQHCSVILSYYFPVPGTLSALQGRESVLMVLPGAAVVGGMRECMDGRGHRPFTSIRLVGNIPSPHGVL